MPRTSIFLLPLLLLPLAAMAQPGKSARGGPESAKAAASDNASRPARRDALREALLAPVVDVPVAQRQLSAQEKQELRRQLRLQREEVLRP